MTNEGRFFEKLFGGAMMTLSETSGKKIRVRSDSAKTEVATRHGIFEGIQI